MDLYIKCQESLALQTAQDYKFYPECRYFAAIHFKIGGRVFMDRDEFFDIADAVDYVQDYTSDKEHPAIDAFVVDRREGTVMWLLKPID